MGQGALKYQSYEREGPEVLFDLYSDPGETRNVLEERIAIDHPAVRGLDQPARATLLDVLRKLAQSIAQI